MRIIITSLMMIAACAVPAQVIDADQTVRGHIALTFDDAPRGDGPYFTGAERTTELINTLASVDVHGAMIFVTTKRIDSKKNDAARLRQYVAAGHPLGNHSHDHPWLRKTEMKDYIADIDMAAAVLAGFDGVEPYFRFPYLDEGRPREKRDMIRKALAERGLKNGYVTVDNYDWYMEALFAEASKAGHPVDMDVLRDTYVELLMYAISFHDEIAKETLGRSPHHVLLLHENDLAALFVDDLVRALRAEGWEIIPALEAFQDPIATIEPDTMFLGQGRVAALAHEQGYSPRQLVSEASDEVYLRTLVCRAWFAS